MIILGSGLLNTPIHVSDLYRKSISEPFLSEGEKVLYRVTDEPGSVSARRPKICVSFLTLPILSS